MGGDHARKLRTCQGRRQLPAPDPAGPRLAAAVDALDELAQDVRRDLGESMLQRRRRAVPLPRATTASLQALKFYADGAEAWSQNSWEEARTLWTRAVELDSGFAWANASVGLATGWLLGPDSARPTDGWHDRRVGSGGSIPWVRRFARPGRHRPSRYRDPRSRCRRRHVDRPEPSPLRLCAAVRRRASRDAGRSANCRR